MPSRTFQIKGTAVIDKVKISAAARQALQNIVLKVDDRSLQNSLKGVDEKIRSLAGGLGKFATSATGGRLASQMNQFSNAVGNANRRTREQATLFETVLRKASAFRVATILINTFVDSIKNSVTGLIAFDKALRDINKITQLNDNDLTKLGANLLGIAANYNQTAESTLKAYEATVKLGYEGEKALEFLNRAGRIAVANNLELADSTKLLVTVSKQAEISLEEAERRIADIGAIANASAVDINDLADIVKRAGTSISQAFNKPKEALGLFAAVAERTQQGGAVVGTFAKTIISRLGGGNAGVLKTFKDLGISVNDLSGKLKDPIKLMTELKERIKGLSEEDVGSILGKIGGVRQIELFRAALASLGEDGGRAMELANTTTTAYADELLRAYENSKSFDAQINKVKNSVLALFASVKDDTIVPFFQKILDIANTILPVFKELGSLIKSAFPVAVFSAIGGIANRITGGKLSGAIAPLSNQSIQQRYLYNSGQSRGILGDSYEDFLGKRSGRTISDVPMESRLVRTVGDRNGIIGFSDMNGEKFSTVATTFNKTVRETNVVMRTFTKTSALLTLAMDKAEQILPAFSLKAALAGVAFNYVGNKLQDFGKHITETSSILGQLTSTAGRITSTFGQLLILGPKIAASAAILNEGFTSVGKLFDFYKAKLQGGYSGKVKEAQLRGENVPAEALAQANLEQILKNVHTGQSNFTPETKQVLDDLALLINQTASSVEDEVANVSNINEKMEIGINKFYSELQKYGEQRNIPTLQLIPQLLEESAFTEKLSAAVRTGLEGQVAVAGQQGRNSGGIIPILKTLFANQAGLPIVPGANITKEQLQYEKELRKLQKELEISTIGLAQSEAELLAARKGFSALESARVEFEYTKKIREARLQSLKQELDDMQEIDRYSGSIGRQKEIVEQLANVLKQIRHSTDKGEILKLNKQRGILENQLNAGPLDFVSEDTKKKRIEVSTLENENAGENIKSVTKIIELERKLRFEQLKNTQDFEDAVMDVRAELSQLVATGRDLNIEEQARLTAAIDIRASEMRLQHAREELNLATQLNKLAGGNANTEQIENLRLKVAIESLNTEKARLSAVMKIEQAELELARTRISGAASAIVKARELSDAIEGIFNAQKAFTNAITGKLNEAADSIKEKRGALASALDSLKGAREGLVQALSSARDGIVNYNTELKKASLDADKVLGKFFGYADQAAATADAFNDIISSAKAAGASMQQLMKLQEESVKEQLSLYQSLLGEQRSKAQQFFTSGPNERVGFVQGLAAIQNIVGRFNGNIQNFRGLNESQLNQFGREILSLPQTLRQEIASALEQIPNGVGIGGLTQDQIKEIFQGATLGESQQIGLDSISKDIETVAELTKQVASINKESLLQNQISVHQAQEAVAQAKEQVLVARLALVQAKSDAIQTQIAVRDVARTLDTQIGQYRDEFKAKTQEIISTIKDPQERQARLADLTQNLYQKISEIYSQKSGQISAVPVGGPADVYTNTTQVSLTRGGQDLLNTVLPEFNRSLKDLNEKFGLNATYTQDVASNLLTLNKLLETQQAKKVEDVKADISINNEQLIKVTGAVEFAEKVADEIKKAGFIDAQQFEQLQTTVESIIDAIVQRDLIRPYEVK